METASSASRPLVIVNPTANRGDILRQRAALLRQLAREDAEYIETTRRGEAGALASTAANAGRAIVLLGGDGTINEVASGILSAGKRVPLGIVPAGSGNDFAWNTLKLPRNIDAAVAIALRGKLADADAGIVNDRYFVNSFSVGLDGDITAAAEHMKRYPFMRGSTLYYTSTLRQLFFGYGRCPWLSIRCDDDVVPPAMQRYVLAAVMNGPTYGAGFRIVPHANFADGAFDLCAVRYTPLLRALRLLPVVKRGDHGNEPEITFFKARSVHITSRQPVNAQIDGETLCDTQFDAQVLPAALLVRVADAP